MLTNQSRWYQGCTIDGGDSERDGGSLASKAGRGAVPEGVDWWRVRVGARAIT